MFTEATATQVVVDEFKLPKTTIHRQIYGKKYLEGGQTLEKLRKSDTKPEKASGSGKGKIAAVIYKKPKSDGKTESKKGKGSGKTSDRKRSAADIRGASTAEDEKKKCEDRKAKATEEEEDEDKPTRAEITASKPASKNLIIH